MKYLITIICAILLVLNGGFLFAQKPYTVPLMEEGMPAPGKRVKVVAEAYENTNIFHSLYLPKNYKSGKKYPVIVEYTGNYAPNLGSTGEQKDAGLSYANAVALEAIWVVMPYLSADGTTSEITWWGSETQTIDYCARQLKSICLDYGGDPSSVFITGFSRGAIAVNRIGLNDDRAADIWLGFHSHDHFDGQRRWASHWANNGDYHAYKADAAERAKRYKGRAAFVSGQNIDSVASYISLNRINSLGKLKILTVPIEQIIPKQDLFVNPTNGKIITHTDKWMNYESPEADTLINWYKNVIRNKPGTYSISGKITNSKGKAVPGVLVETGFQGIDYNGACTHFDITNIDGEYQISGLIKGERFLNVIPQNGSNKIVKTQNIALFENSTVDMVVDTPKDFPEEVTSIDIILLMGQSNMKGRGKVPENQEIHPRIVYMNMVNDEWYPAIHPLHTDGIPDLIDGKSNAGVGPGLDFAKILAEKDSTTCIALIPCAKGGSWIDLWMPGKELYTETLRRAKKALVDFSNEGVEVNIKAALWLQGESDAKEGRYQVYEAKLKTMVDSLRADLDVPELPFISATIGTFMEGIADKYPFYNEINTMLLNAGAVIDNYHCVDARDIRGHIGDDIHYNTASQEKIGKRMGEAYLELIKK